MTALNIHRYLVFILFTLFCSSPEASSFDDSEIKHIGYPDWFNENPFNELSLITNDSIASGKKGLLVLFTTEGCSYCDHFIRKSLGDSDIASIVQNNFESVGLEIFDDAEMTTPDGETKSIKQFATDEKVQFSPTLLFYGEAGKRIFRLTGYQSPERFRKVLDYVTNEHYRSISFRNYLLSKKTASELVDNSDNNSAELKPDPVFEKPPYALDRRHFPASEPLLVIFEEPGCTDCKNFHADVLSEEEVRKTLRQFEVVRLDARDDKTSVLAPDGSKLTPAKWYEKSEFTQVPAMLFFDENGKLVLKNDALTLTQRMMNSLNYVLEKAYEDNWTYQQFARSKAIEKSKKQKKQQ